MKCRSPLCDRELGASNKSGWCKVCQKAHQRWYLIATGKYAEFRERFNATRKAWRQRKAGREQAARGA